ncbi:molybdopterin molybdotransferase [Andreprevotia lacus DSM 23236]|uniref:Molybdopterin molybdenumtransferase n=1 Tax=Andreprevotia lacus DSM 23236 TaxID=1121001 RepID=A0A1W1XHT9_9NEIS|nr:gephyrin-like molybdotransferase Glp [Andreprevotia lacus]SMC23071.1 molybdopterin molybdotransferase [Andreprevotia lacus DSM 23236]
MLTVSEALDRLLTAARPSTATQTLPLAQAHGRIAAAEYRASVDVPALDNSAMDGYALALPFDAPLPDVFPVAQRIAAGQVGSALAPLTAARIFTGAPVPNGATCVVMQEDCDADEHGLRLKPGITPHPDQHIRRRGEDIAQNSVLLQSGEQLDAARIALLAAGGIAEVAVHAPLRVTLLSTGDELAEPGTPLPPGGVYNSNRPMLLAMLQALGCEVIDGGMVPDRRDATEAALLAAAQQSDVVISTGGVSVGEEDHVKAALQALGTLDLWKVAIKPGKPLALGRIGKADFVGLPGNPVSAYVTLQVLVRPFLRKRMGAHQLAPTVWPLPAAFDWPRPDKRQEYLRAALTPAGLQLVGQQGSAMISGLAGAHGLVEVPPGQVIQPGDTVRFLPFTS